MNGSRRVPVLFTGLMVLMFVVFAGLGYGQTVSGTLRGTVTDANGAYVPNATVTIRSIETGLERTVVTSGEGLYNIPFVPIGQYNLEATRTDFNRVVRENVIISLNETAVINIRLDPSVTGEVTIDAEPAIINTTNSQIAGSLSASQIQERPVANQGNFLTLAETFTGYQENPTGGQNNPTASSGSSVNFNGTGTRGATFQINGVNNDDSSENQNRQGASLATVKEFQVITNNFTAEFGRGYGAVVLVQTLSGTNNINGAAYWYHNDQALNAKSFFSHGKKPVFRRNQFGGVLGFPVWKDKLFGFVSADELRNTGGATFTRDVPLPSERDPANWFQISPQNDTPGNRAFIQSVFDRFGDLTPNDPANRSPRTHVGVIGTNFPANDYSARVDWNASSKDTVFARWQYTRQIFAADDLILGERADQNNKQQNWGLTWTHLFTPNLVGEFRYGLGLRNTLVNITAGNDTPIMRFQNPDPVVSGSIIGNAGTFPIQRYQTDNQYVYNISSVLGGNHFFKAGTDIRMQNLDDLADSFSRGFYSFNGTCNGIQYRDPRTATSTNPLGNLSGFLALINGCVSQFQKGYGPFFLENRIGEYNVYAEDNWKISPRLTLNIGARYEYVNAPRESENRMEYGFSDDKDNIEPRVGFAYSPGFESGFLNTLFGDSDESSIRGGYGIYHGRLFQSIFSQGGATVRFNPPNAFNYVRNGTLQDIFDPNNLPDPTRGFVFVPGAPLTSRAALTIVDPNLEMPYTQQWNLTFERQLPWSSAIRLSYTGNRGIGLLKYTMQNLPRNDPAGVLVADHPFNGALRGQTITPAANLFCAGTTTANTLCPVTPIGPLEYSRVVPRTNERRPDPRYTTNLEVSNGSWSYYNALQVELSKRLSHGFNFQAAYTWSKSIDTTSEATFVGAGDSNILGPDAKTSRGYSRFHTPHRFTFFGTFRNPFFDKDRGILGYVLGGWDTSVVFKWVHGTPFTVTGTGFDLNLDGFAENRPVLLDPSVLGRSIDDPETSRDMLPQSAFASPTSAADYQCCILGRNTFFIDGVKNVDISLYKRFYMPWERHSLTIRADMFNAFNHVQWGFPNATYTSTALGTLTGLATQYAPRNIQVSLKYAF
ncbi:MAG: TonB-dependent receptor [Pyrinomonadaceae bacterium]